ncbi:12023_t:CDS:2, partial [Racocetra persica]
RKYEENFTSLPDSKENIIDVNNITDVIYKALANVEDINENLESSCEFYFEQAINLDMLINEILADTEENKYEYYLASKIVNYIEKEDEQVKQYVRENLVLRASELHREIISKKLDGFETLTIDQ